MHRFHSKSIIFRFRFAAFFLCLKYLFPMAALTLMILSVTRNEKILAEWAILAAALTLVDMAIQYFIARRALCPLCMTQVLVSKGCAKHRNSRTLLGSHRLRVAVALLTRGNFICPYCHETSEMKVRVRRH